MLLIFSIQDVWVNVIDSPCVKPQTQKACNSSCHKIRHNQVNMLHPKLIFGTEDTKNKTKQKNRWGSEVPVLKMICWSVLLKRTLINLRAPIRKFWLHLNVIKNDTSKTAQWSSGITVHPSFNQPGREGGWEVRFEFAPEARGSVWNQFLNLKLSSLYQRWHLSDLFKSSTLTKRTFI